jgi:aminoglycoside 6'-N-acetyltransferase
MRVRGRLTTVRRAAEEDADLLVRWHADPDVARYWDDEVFTRDEMLERLRRPDVEAFVIEEGAQPVGYLQVWAEGGEGGLDMFLIPDARGRGLGPDAARAVALHLRSERGW